MKYLLSIVFILASLLMQAQPESKAYTKFKEDIRFAIGSITDLQGKKIEGLVEKLEFDTPYRKVVFVTPESGKQVFRPHELKGYDILYTKFISDGVSFLELVREEDRIELFKKIIMNYNTVTTGSPGMPVMIRKKDEDMITTIFYVKKKGQNTFVKLSKRGFTGQAYKMILDCKELVDDIKKGVVKRKSTDEIIYRYNKTCK